MRTPMRFLSTLTWLAGTGIALEEFAFAAPPGIPVIVENPTTSVSVNNTVPVTGNVAVTGSVTVNNATPIPVLLSGSVPVAVTVSTPPGTTVNVANPVSINGTVPVSGTVGIAGTPTVNIATMPAITTTITDPAKTGFTAVATATLLGTNSKPTTYMVSPQAGTRLVVEFASVVCEINSGAPIPALAVISYSTVGSSSASVPIPMMPSGGTASASQAYIGTLSARLYADYFPPPLSGAVVIVVSGSLPSDYTAQSSCNLTVSGYSVPYP